jgi:hypothetical protein
MQFKLGCLSGSGLCQKTISKEEWKPIAERIYFSDLMRSTTTAEIWEAAEGPVRMTRKIGTAPCRT